MEEIEITIEKIVDNTKINISDESEINYEDIISKDNETTPEDEDLDTHTEDNDILEYIQDDEDDTEEINELIGCGKEIKQENKKIVIDRDQENKDVAEFQKTGNKDLLEKVYLARIPTIKFWAKKHYYPGLTLSEDDLFGELSIVFVKATKHYKITKGSFNTCLYTFFLNRLKNIKSSIHAKKRVSEEYNGPASAMVLSIDYEYVDKSGAEVSLKDVIPSKDPNPYTLKSYDDILDLMSNGDVLVKNFLNKVGQGESISTLLKEVKIEHGSPGYKRVTRALKNIKKNKSTIIPKIKQLE